MSSTVTSINISTLTNHIFLFIDGNNLCNYADDSTLLISFIHMDTNIFV